MIRQSWRWTRSEVLQDKIPEADNPIEGHKLFNFKNAVRHARRVKILKESLCRQDLKQAHSTLLPYFIQVPFIRQWLLRKSQLELEAGSSKS
jgi:hypothetical protein